MKRIAALSLGLFFSASVFSIDMPPTAPIKSIDWLPASTVRIGLGINAAYLITTKVAQKSEVWIHTDCRNNQKTLLFINPQPGTGLRVYSAQSVDHYIPGTPFEMDNENIFMRKSDLNLCDKKIPEPIWAGLSTWNQPGETLFVDTHNFKREGTTLKVRLATDYDKIHYEEKYGAPYSVKIQDILLNCEKGEVKELITFLLDNQGIVSDSYGARNTTFVTPSPGMDGAVQELCAIKNITHYTGKGTLIWRNKETVDNTSPLPDFENNSPAALARYGLPTGVSDTVKNTYSRSNQKPLFHSLHYTQTGPEKDGISLMARIDAQSDGTTLTIMKMAIGNVVFYQQYQRLFNMVDVKKWETMSEAPWISNKIDSSISLPLLPGKIYLAHSLIDNKSKPGQDKLITQKCVTGKEWLKSSALNIKFPGRYLEFICKQDLGDGREVIGDYAYFEDLRIFLRIGFQDHGLTKRFTFTEVKIEH